MLVAVSVIALNKRHRCFGFAALLAHISTGSLHLVSHFIYWVITVHYLFSLILLFPTEVSYLQENEEVNRETSRIQK